MQPGIGIARMQDFASARVYNHGGIGRRLYLGRGNQHHPKREKNTHDPRHSPGQRPLPANQVVKPDLHDICHFCLLPPVFRLTILPAMQRA